MTTDTIPVSMRSLSALELEERLGVFVELLRDVVDSGVPMGFHAPLSPADALDYWLSLRRELNAGSRVLLAAYVDDRIVGSGQLSLATSPNALHRADLQKLFVWTGMRGRGVGRALMLALEEQALALGRTLITLNTRLDLGAEAFYEELGYSRAGVIPGWTIAKTGERYDTVVMYRDLSS